MHNMSVQNQSQIRKSAFLKLAFKINRMTHVELHIQMFALRLHPSVVKISYSAHEYKKKNIRSVQSL